MTSARFIAGDWGTSHLRLALCTAGGDVLDQTHGPGAAACSGSFASVFAEAITPWSEHGPLPALLCGMVGSRQGWVQAPYLRCPVSLDQIAANGIAVATHDVHILPGLTCINPLGAVDFLRGEETQVLGAVQLDARLREGRHLILLPGTHSKWLWLDDAQVQQFQTVVTGELYAVLHAHSVLVTSTAGTQNSQLDGAFLQGLNRARAATPNSLLAHLFECRARRLAGELQEGEDSAFLSGLLIGHELRFGLNQAALIPETQVWLIGTTALMQRYAYALSVFGISAQCLDGGQAAIAGLATAYRHLHVEEC